jgi:hypothetical protein
MLLVKIEEEEVGGRVKFQDLLVDEIGGRPAAGCKSVRLSCAVMFIS